MFKKGVLDRILSRWKAAGEPSVESFAPYFRFVLSVDLFFYLAIASGLISGSRPSNITDISYLYYLPFCMVFTSSDNLHLKTVPLFLNSHQIFIKGADLKADLAKIDDYYSNFPDDIKNQGVYKFASNPPEDTAFLVTRLWDRYLPKWREINSKKSEDLNKEDNEALINRINSMVAKAKQSDASATKNSLDNMGSLVITRTAYCKKGKWNRFPPEVKGSF